MNKVHEKKVLKLAVTAGQMMMECGAEVYRIEDTIGRICKAYGINEANAFVTGTGIFVSITPDNDESAVQTQIKRIYNSSINLKKISEINNLSREITYDKISVNEALNKLYEIQQIKDYPLPIRLLAAAGVAVFFCAANSGTMIDMIVAFFLGILCYGTSLLLDFVETNFFFRIFISCSLATLIALFLNSNAIVTEFNGVVIGCIMLFVPGVAITNSIRDFLSGDILAGVSRMSEALLVAIALASSVGVSLQIWSVLGGVL
ncbi:MAG: threonine/serine exporter family protein [Anaerovoracaceae bacterium]